MSNISVDYDILNQKQTPAFYASSLATRPAFGFPGRIFIDTDTPSSGIYRDTGSAWVQVADPGAGTTGTLQQVTTNGNTTTNSIQVQGIDFSDGAGTGLYNIAIGNQTMGANTTGNNNIAIGYQNLKFNTTGALNVSVGNTALVNNTTGSQNTAVGQLALNLNTTGAQNTALGNAALQNNTTGASNTAIGHASLVANTTASFNTAIGQDTLRSNTTGLQNVAVGYTALFNNTTGQLNTAIGVSSLYANTTANNNTAIGNASLTANTTGANNTAIGSASLSANTTGALNTSVGYDNLSANTTGQANTSVGNQALKANTTASGNNAFGHQALLSNTTGDSNIAIGNLALKSNITNGGNTAVGTNALLTATADYNTAIGYAALLYNTTGTNNVSVGASALQNNTTGNGNTSIGKSALQNNTTGANNVAIGYGALTLNTTASNNTAIGNTSLEQNTTGVNNTAIGSSSLKANTTGQNNLSLGTSSLILNTTGAQNTAIGSSALSANTTGTYNTAIGYNAGSLITTGGKNTILGSYAGTTTMSNYIVLSDGDANVRLFANDTGRLGINVPITDTPTGQCDIHTSLTNALVLNGLTTNNSYLAFANAGVNKWRIGNFYNAGANSFDIYNLGTSSTALSFNSTTNDATFLKTIVASSTGSNGLKIYGGSGTNQWDVYLNSTNLRFSDNTGTGSVVFDRPISGTSATFSSSVTAVGGIINGTTDAFFDINRSASGNAGRVRFQTAGTDEFEIGLKGGVAGFHITKGDATELVTVLTSGNVGIGTDTPTDGKFVVAQSAVAATYKTDIALVSTGSQSTNSHGIDWFDRGIGNDNSGRIAVIRESSSPVYAMAFYTANASFVATERMRITSSGNVLIGTTTDDTINKLQVQGSASIKSYIKLNTLEAPTVSTSATIISTVNNTYGGIAIVWGNDSGNIFTDLVFYSLSTTYVINGQNISGGPSARIYTCVSGDLKLAMSSGSYAVRFQAIVTT